MGKRRGKLGRVWGMRRYGKCGLTLLPRAGMQLRELRALSVPMAVPFEGDDESPLIPFLTDRDEADRLAGAESWRVPTTRRLDPHLEPYTLPWFLQIERRRYARHGGWIPRALEFSRHRGDKLLALGDGLGTDWVRYAENGSDVIVCSRSPIQRMVVRRHFELRAVRGEFLEGEPTQLPVPTHGMDVVCLTERDWTGDDLEASVAEIYRVLKPGGKVLAVFPAAYDAIHFRRMLMPWQRWFGTAPRRDQRRRFRAAELKELFCRFDEVRVSKRHLRRSDLPHLWRVMPLPVLERVMGRYLIVKAFKPLSSVRELRIAA